MLTTIIIDRVGNTNVFNLIQEHNINYMPGADQHNLQSVVDSDLIDEYVEELDRVSKVARSISVLPRGDEEKQAAIFQHLNLNLKLRQIGEAFYRQFFPESLKIFFRETDVTYLYFNVDQQLASIPFEILHDGDQFLCEKYYLGKTIKGQRLSLAEIPPREKLSMLIIADPTEDLEWARKEGEVLFEYLSTKFPEKKITIELLGGRSITKLSLLNAIKNKDIVHFAGHLHYTDIASENGWLLYGNKIVRAREIQNSGAEPLLIFSNACVSGRSSSSAEKSSHSDWYSRFAASFLRSEKTAYIGTNWELPDSRQTLDFTIQFYNFLLAGNSTGEAILKSRQYARENFSTNDLTWASYILIGNPKAVLLQSEQRLPDLRAEILLPENVLEKYPFPIAQAYQNFLLQAKQNSKNSRAIISSMFVVYTETISLLTAIILSNYDYLKFPRPIAPATSHLKDQLDALFQALGSIGAIKARPLAQNLFEVLYQHRDNLYKLAQWHDKFSQGTITEGEVESYEITVQYILETFLHDIDFLKNYGFYIVLEPGYKQLSLAGIPSYHRVKEIILPTQTNLATYEELLEKTESLVGKFVFYNPIKKIFLDLSPYVEVLIRNESKKDYIYQLRYRYDD